MYYLVPGDSELTKGARRGRRAGEGTAEHVSERFRRLLEIYRLPDGSEWGGEDLQDATGADVARILARHDSMGLDAAGAPADEYDSEARTRTQPAVAA